MCSDFPTFRSFGCAKKKKDKGNEIFCGKRSKQKENGKKQNKHETNRFCEEKREMITRREKQGDTQKGNRKKKRIIKDPTQEMKDK